MHGHTANVEKLLGLSLFVLHFLRKRNVYQWFLFLFKLTIIILLENKDTNIWSDVFLYTA